ncbi:MAG TPA: FAD binding domain-containing protein [Terriglobia bacterium]|nr:FAD binding domain-containing protein [Terriglobia bacterium]
MQAFEYARPKTAKDAVKLLSSNPNDAELLAGGSDLLDRMKDDVSAPKRVVSLADARDLRGIEYKPATGLRIGAMTTLEELGADAQVRRHYAALAQAVEDIAGPQIRNVGTVGGNLCQRPRCWYYRAGYGLLAMHNGKPLVPDGDNRYHAILGNAGPAYFVSPSSLAPALIAFGAKLRLLGPKGAREMPVDKFFVIPRAEGEREHALKSDEIISEVLVPPSNGARSGFYEIRQKESMDWALGIAAVALHMKGQTVERARVVMGQVAPIPWPSPEAEQELMGKTISEEVADAAGQAAVSKAAPLNRNGYKVQLARVAVKRAILRAAGAMKEA